jgi:hypothetical protein
MNIEIVDRNLLLSFTAIAVAMLVGQWVGARSGLKIFRGE